MFALLFKFLSLEQLISGVISAATKAQDNHQSEASYLANQAATLQQEAADHTTKANQAANVLTVLQGLLG